jgi:hypothetical protein
MFKNSQYEAFATAMGYPNTPLPPDGVAVGPFGWTLEQAQGTTATFATGTIINFPVVTGAGGTAGTPGRLGPVLDGFSSAAAPDVVARISRMKLIVSALFAQTNAAQLTEEFLADLTNNLFVRWSPSNGRPIDIPFGPDGIGTIAADSGATDTTTAGASGYRRSPSSHSAVWVPVTGGIEVDLSQDNFSLEARAAIALPQGATVRLDTWFDGVLARKAGWSDQRSTCDANNAQAVANLAQQTRSIAFLRPRG